MKCLLFSGLISLIILSGLFSVPVSAQARAVISVTVIVHPSAVAPARVSTSFSTDTKQEGIREHTKDAFSFHEDTSVSMAVTKDDALSASPKQTSMHQVHTSDDLISFIEDFCEQKSCLGASCKRDVCVRENPTTAHEQYKVVLVYN
jgi:hypothetical protein